MTQFRTNSFTWYTRITTEHLSSSLGSSFNLKLNWRYSRYLDIICSLKDPWYPCCNKETRLSRTKWVRLLSSAQWIIRTWIYQSTNRLSTCWVYLNRRSTWTEAFWAWRKPLTLSGNQPWPFSSVACRLSKSWCEWLTSCNPFSKRPSVLTLGASSSWPSCICCSSSWGTRCRVTTWNSKRTFASSCRVSCTSRGSRRGSWGRDSRGRSGRSRSKRPRGGTSGNKSQS